MKSKQQFPVPLGIARDRGWEQQAARRRSPGMIGSTPAGHGPSARSSKPAAQARKHPLRRRIQGPALLRSARQGRPFRFGVTAGAYSRRT